MKNEIIKRVLSSIVIIPLALFCIISGSYIFNFFLIIIFAISVLEWHNLSRKKPYFIFGLFYLIFSFFYVYRLRFYPDNDYFLFLIVTSVCVLTDIGGYVFGNLFKGPKLTKFSPNKTYSGLIGSYIFALTVIPLLIATNGNETLKVFNLFIFIILVSTISQFGDIIVSIFKRISKIKDTGKIIPGHGGLLDRIDGMIFAFPVSYLLLNLNFFDIFK